MKNLLIFLFGAGVGAGATLLFLRKGIKKRLEDLAKAMAENGDTQEEPFVMEEQDSQPTAEPAPQEVTGKDVRTEYYKIVEETEKGTARPSLDVYGPIDGSQIVEIDLDDYMHDHSVEKDRLVYYKGDNVLTTEEGEIIKNPAMYIGTGWEKYVDHYAENTAFVRNNKLSMDYEIYVEEGYHGDPRDGEIVYPDEF